MIRRDLWRARFDALGEHCRPMVFKTKATRALIVGLVCVFSNTIVGAVGAESQPDQEQAMAKAMALRESEKYSEALKVYDEILAKYPDLALAHQERGATLASLGRYDDAIRAENRALKRDPKLFRAHIYKGMIYANRERYAHAHEEFTKAKEVKPDSYIVHMRLAVVSSRLKRTEEAIAEYKKASELNPQKAAPHRKLSTVLLTAGDVDEGIKEAEEAAKIEPGAVTFNHLGKVYSLINRLDESEKLLKQAIAADSSYLPAYGNLALVLTLKGQYEEAKKVYEKQLELNPNDQEAKRELRKLSNDSIERLRIKESSTGWVKTAEGFKPQVSIVVENMSGKDLSGRPIELRVRFERCSTGTGTTVKKKLESNFSAGAKVQTTVTSDRPFALEQDSSKWPYFRCFINCIVGDTSDFEWQYVLGTLVDKKIVASEASPEAASTSNQ